MVSSNKNNSTSAKWNSRCARRSTPLGIAPLDPSNNEHPRKPKHGPQPRTGCRREVAATLYPFKPDRFSPANWIRLTSKPHRERLLLVRVTWCGPVASLLPGSTSHLWPLTTFDAGLSFPLRRWSTAVT